MASHSSILTWKNPMNRGSWWITVRRGCKESNTTELLSMHTGALQISQWRLASFKKKNFFSPPKLKFVLTKR